jgi:hypothetical protein
MNEGSESLPAGAATSPAPIAGLGNAALDDPRAIAVLTTERASLISARALVYNEAFERGGMFLSFLSATLVALGLVATASGLSNGFLTVAAVLLALNLFVGFASLGRIAAASNEDIRYLQGMNRLRHAYHEMVPGLEGYFIASHHDDIESVLEFYGPAAGSPIRSILHGLTTTPGMLSVICSAVAGSLGAVIALLAAQDARTAAVMGGVAFVVVFVALTALFVVQVRRGMHALHALFPRPDPKTD